MENRKREKRGHRENGSDERRGERRLRLAFSIRAGPGVLGLGGVFGGPSAEEENMEDKVGGDANPSGAESVSLGLRPCPRHHTKLSGDVTGIVSSRAYVCVNECVCINLSM